MPSLINILFLWTCEWKMLNWEILAPKLFLAPSNRRFQPVPPTRSVVVHDLCKFLLQGYKRIWFYFRRILSNKPPIPSSFTPVTRSFILQLLDKDPQTRLGSTSSSQVKNHPFFKVRPFTKLLSILSVYCRRGAHITSSLVPRPALSVKTL